MTEPYRNPAEREEETLTMGDNELTAIIIRYLSIIAVILGFAGLGTCSYVNGYVAADIARQSVKASETQARTAEAQRDMQWSKEHSCAK